MSKKAAALLMALGLAVASSAASAATITFQPGPDTSKDIWTTSVYSYAPGGGGPGGGLANDRLRVGGWGDTYYSLLQFDVSKLPTNVVSASLRLFNNAAPGENATAVNLARIDTAWDWRTMGTGSDRDRLWWADKPSATVIASNLSPSPPGSYTDFDITGLYTSWKSGATPNNGVELQPVTTSFNNFDEFSSSRDPFALNRPALVLQTQDVGGPDFGFPIKGGSGVDVVTMAGGLSSDRNPINLCGGSTAQGTPLDPCHTAGQAYYAVDFAEDKAGATNAIVAAGSGTVSEAKAVCDGASCYAKIAIDHGPLDGSSEHYFTVYQEFVHGTQSQVEAALQVHVGDKVAEGQTIGELDHVGNDHLHFQVGYGDSIGHSSLAYSDALGGVTLNGKLLTSYTLEGIGTCRPASIDTVSGNCNGILASAVGSAVNAFMPVIHLDTASLFNVEVGNLGVGVTTPAYFDPAASSGYEFDILAGPAFASLWLTQQASDYELWLFDPATQAFLFSQFITGGSPFDFGPGGVLQFRLFGVLGGQEFIPGFTFTEAGEVTFLETPLGGAVPEPNTWILAIGGLGLVGLRLRRDRQSRRILATA